MSLLYHTKIEIKCTLSWGHSLHILTQILYIIFEQIAFGYLSKSSWMKCPAVRASIILHSDISLVCDSVYRTDLTNILQCITLCHHIITSFKFVIHVCIFHIMSMWRDQTKVRCNETELLACFLSGVLSNIDFGLRVTNITYSKKIIN